MASFAEAPPGVEKSGEKIFKTKCAQCHTVDKGAGHKQGPILSFTLSFFSVPSFLFSLSFDLLSLFFLPFSSLMPWNRRDGSDLA